MSSQHRTHIIDPTRLHKAIVWDCYGGRKWVRTRMLCGHMYDTDSAVERPRDATCARCKAKLARIEREHDREIRREVLAAADWEFA